MFRKGDLIINSTDGVKCAKEIKKSAEDLKSAFKSLKTDLSGLHETHRDSMYYDLEKTIEDKGKHINTSVNNLLDMNRFLLKLVKANNKWLDPSNRISKL